MTTTCTVANVNNGPTFSELEIADITVNEGSDWAVFTVNGPVGDVFF